MDLRSFAAAASFASLVLAVRVAAAEEGAPPTPPFEIGSRPAWFLMGGATGGATVTSQRGGYVGGELSLVRLRDARFFGFYGDGYYDFGIHRTYTTGGLELGYKFLGFDAGGAARLGGARVEPGATGRVFVTIGLVALYVRYAYFDADRDDQVVQVGALVKLPLLSPFGVPNR